MAKETKPRTPKNVNLGSFVDAVTPEPIHVTGNYINFDVLTAYLKTANPEAKTLIHTMIDIALSTSKQEEFLSLGEKIAINSLRKVNILF